MKANPLWIRVLLVLGAAIFQLPAQQTEADRKLFAVVRAKAENGDPQAQSDLGRAFDFGNLGVAKDGVEAVKWYRKAAEQNYATAQYNLGCCYAEGEGVLKDDVQAVKWFRKAAEQSLAQAQYNLGNCYYNGIGVSKEDEEAVRWFRQAAELNYAPAQYNLGNCYLKGEGVGKDEAEAIKWYRRAADQSLPVAQFDLGCYYSIGQGVTRDEVEAVKWYRKAAEQNFVMAQYSLGLCYDNGDGVVKEYVEAVKWYRRAAEQNCAKAQNNLGSCYVNGKGVPKDSVEGVKWYRKAANQNEPVGQLNLGAAYEQGSGVLKDDVEAVKWYRKAADQNFAMAQYNLGVCYLKGQGVTKDYVEGYKWSLLAAAQGVENGKTNATIVENKMTREQIAEGQKLARNFNPREMPSSTDKNSNMGILQTRPESSGSGFFITDDGYLVSNYHVIKDATQVRLVTGSGLIAAKVMKVDAANDLALLKAEGHFTSLPIVSTRAVKLGSTVATVGFPNIGLQGFAPKLAKGEIASLSGAADDARYFQISVPVQPGNSGGALVDERGNVVGIVAAKLNAGAALDATGALPENVNYAVKSSFLLSFLESVPEVASKLKEPNVKEEKFEDVVKSAQDAAVLVLVY